MKSAKCAQCGFVGWLDAESCKKCGAPMSPAAAAPDMAYQPDGNVTTYYSPQNVPAEDLKTGWATASLMMGIANFLILGIFLLPSIAGIIVSVVALNKIKRNPWEYGGKGLAIGGLVTNIVSVVLLIPFMIIAAITIPSLMASRMAANEGATIRSMRIIHAAESTYQATAGRGEYGQLNDLQRENLISAELAKETRMGYQIKVEVFRHNPDHPAGFTVVAVPTEYRSSGRRSFFIDETGVIRGEDRQGTAANNATPPLQFETRDYPSDARRSARYGDDE